MFSMAVDVVWYPANMFLGSLLEVLDDIVRSVRALRKSERVHGRMWQEKECFWAIRGIIEMNVNE